MARWSVGLAGVCVAAVGWGSNYVVVKGYRFGDGLAFQLWLCTGILAVGVLSLLLGPWAAHRSVGEAGLAAEAAPTLSLLGLVGGGCWALGNLLTVPIVERVGLGMGLPVWAGASLLVAFGIGRAGPCIGGVCLEVRPLARPACAVAGCVSSVLALLAFSLIRPEHLREDGLPPAYLPLHPKPSRTHTTIHGTALALIAGSLYGCQFLPSSLYAQMHPEEAGAASACRFFFSQALGIFLVALASFGAYATLLAVRRTPMPEVPLQAMWPTVCCGGVWAVAAAAAMVATDNLGMSIGYPLTMNAVFVVNQGWAVLYFGEVRAARNLYLLALAAALDVTGSVLLSIST